MLCATRVIIAGALCSIALAAEPQPGDVFREYHFTRRFSEIDPEAKRPNTEHYKKIAMSERGVEIPDIRGVVKAEISVEYWGGHIGTTEQKFRVNGGSWLPIEQPQGTPEKPNCYYRTILGRATTEIPVDQLKSGRNVFQFTAGPQACFSFNWGFYWVYGFTVRLYGKPPAQPFATVTSPSDGGSAGDQVRLLVEGGRPDMPIVGVDYIARYEDFNQEGDGEFRQWHYITQKGMIARHIGSSRQAPYAVTWDTSWVPDQDQPIEIMARVTDADGIIHMTSAVKVHLRREGRSVRMYKAENVPQGFGTRLGRKKECNFTIGESDNLKNARTARILLSTWSAAHEGEIGLNGQKLTDHFGLVHNYSFDTIAVPVTLLKPGTNTFYLTSPTKEHAAEINWPGPVLLVEYGSPAQQNAASWHEPKARERFAVDINARGVAREDAIVEARLPSNPGSVRVVDAVTGQDMPSQIDGAEVAFVAKGSTLGARRFHVYSLVSKAAHSGIAEPADCAGQPSVRIKTPAASYCYQKEGAGFASIVDPEGREWIGYAPGGRASGEFRGIPNLHKQFGHPGYSGASGSETTVVADGPVKVSLLSQRKDRSWAMRWDIFPSHARMTLLRAAEPYWFLYEGTPGGKLDEKNGFLMTSDGRKRSLSDRWSGDLPAPEWLYFGNADSKRVLYVVNHSDDTHTDQYWPMDGAMTVFGFGRQYRCCGQYLSAAPAQFTIGLALNGSFDEVARRIEGTWREMSVTVGLPERR